MRTLQFDPELAWPLFSSLDQIHLVMINPVGPGVHGKDFGTDIETALAEAAKANANGFNIYWTVNRVAPGLNKKPGKRDIRAARFVHVDIDPPNQLPGARLVRSGCLPEHRPANAGAGFGELSRYSQSRTRTQGLLGALGCHR